MAEKHRPSGYTSVRIRILIVLTLALLAGIVLFVRFYCSAQQRSQINHTLLEAIYSMDFEQAQAALQNGADPDARDDNDDMYKVKQPTLWQRLEDNWSEIRGGNPEITGRPTVLMLAIQMGEVEIARKLITQGANVNLRDSQGWTALDYAETMGYSEYTPLGQALLKAGARPGKTGTGP